MRFGTLVASLDREPDEATRERLENLRVRLRARRAMVCAGADGRRVLDHVRRTLEKSEEPVVLVADEVRAHRPPRDLLRTGYDLVALNAAAGSPCHDLDETHRPGVVALDGRLVVLSAAAPTLRLLARAAALDVPPAQDQVGALLTRALQGHGADPVRCLWLDHNLLAPVPGWGSGTTPSLETAAGALGYAGQEVAATAPCRWRVGEAGCRPRAGRAAARLVRPVLLGRGLLPGFAEAPETRERLADPFARRQERDLGATTLQGRGGAPTAPTDSVAVPGQPVVRRFVDGSRLTSELEKVAPGEVLVLYAGRKPERLPSSITFADVALPHVGEGAGPWVDVGCGGEGGVLAVANNEFGRAVAAVADSFLRVRSFPDHARALELAVNVAGAVHWARVVRLPHEMRPSGPCADALADHCERSRRLLRQAASP